MSVGLRVRGRFVKDLRARGSRTRLVIRTVVSIAGTNTHIFGEIFIEQIADSWACWRSSSHPDMSKVIMT